MALTLYCHIAACRREPKVKSIAQTAHSRAISPAADAQNYGAILCIRDFLSPDEVEEARLHALAKAEGKQAVHQDGKYSAIKWFKHNLDPNWRVAKKIIDELGVTDPELLVFYYLEPGAKIHPHRDLSGASLSNRIRFHVPIITNPDVVFMVDNKRVVMKPSELWCLDTSYIHSVENNGSETRVHIVIECSLTENIKKYVPSDLKSKIHTISFIFIMSWLFVKSLFVNIFKDPSYLWSQVKMIVRYVGWRFLGIGNPK
jgi:hypothetical protein